VVEHRSGERAVGQTTDVAEPPEGGHQEHGRDQPALEAAGPIRGRASGLLVGSSWWGCAHASKCIRVDEKGPCDSYPFRPVTLAFGPSWSRRRGDGMKRMQDVVGRE